MNKEQTETPFWSKHLAVAKPIPPKPPVIIAVFPFRDIFDVNVQNID